MSDWTDFKMILIIRLMWTGGFVFYVTILWYLQLILKIAKIDILM